MSDTESNRKAAEVQLEGGNADNHHLHPLSSRRPVSVMLTDEQFKAFEMAYLTPGVAAAPNAGLRFTLGNPTALGLVSLLLSLFPLSINWLQWGLNNRSGIITLTGSFYFTSGIGLTIAGLLEWILGNTFIFLVFTTVGGFVFSLGAGYDPQFHIAETAMTVGPGTLDQAALNQGYYAGQGIWLLSWSFLIGIYIIGCLRVNAVLTAMIVNITGMFLSVGLANYYAAKTEAVISSHMITAGGALGFIASVLCWYMVLGFVLQSVGWPGLPVGDLTSFWTARAKKSA